MHATIAEKEQTKNYVTVKCRRETGGRWQEARWWHASWHGHQLTLSLVVKSRHSLTPATDGRHLSWGYVDPTGHLAWLSAKKRDYSRSLQSHQSCVLPVFADRAPFDALITAAQAINPDWAIIRRNLHAWRHLHNCHPFMLGIFQIDLSLSTR